MAIRLQTRFIWYFIQNVSLCRLGKKLKEAYKNETDSAYKGRHLPMMTFIIVFFLSIFYSGTKKTLIQRPKIRPEKSKKFRNGFHWKVFWNIVQSGNCVWK